MTGELHRAPDGLPICLRRRLWVPPEHAELPGHPKIGPWVGWITHHFFRPDVPASFTTDREAACMRGVDQVHRENGWGGIGYGFTIFDSGRLWEGRGWSRTGAHTEGQNSKKMGVAFAINGDKHFPSDAAWATYAGLIIIGEEYGLVKPGAKLERHHDYAVKSCPGTLVTVTKLAALRAWLDAVTP